MIIFLDIDGVMVHANPMRKVELEEDGFYKFNPKAVQILQATVYSTKDKIILSTSHRFKYSIAEWKEIFERRGLNFKNLNILDLKDIDLSESDFSSSNIKISRKNEIFNWIKIHKLKFEDFIIIDDDKSLNDLPPKFKERLVLTNSYVGLNDQNDLKIVLKRKVKKIINESNTRSINQEV
ncbi:HAD domain-containing protein [Sphingobacterium sp. 2149]|uniref:HAD domain-containing protein n=1 Tax=Sphingobacterium sp. 2149 TaxID=2817763 RepID=UPI00285C4D4F|nr:HAD domain-containing protein [Sphingobacterium sp. 2149]MDR6734907.1 hypothetical protein [Sphingobacterium sp. 2149]